MLFLSMRAAQNRIRNKKNKTAASTYGNIASRVKYVNGGKYINLYYILEELSWELLIGIHIMDTAVIN